MSSKEFPIAMASEAVTSIIPELDGMAIRVQNLSKSFHIYDLPRHRLQQFILPGFTKLAGRVPRDYFREYWALRDVSFEVKKGETVGIVGRNGSGKSSLLQIICGTLTPTSGIVETQGRIAALLELGSGFNPEFTGLENIYLNGAVLGLKKKEIDDRLDDILTFADIGGFINQPVKTYSSGMAVRLAFAVQTVVDPDIFIVDEALAVGDEKFQRKCFSRLEELKNNGTSILFVSHSATSVIELCDRALLMNEGSRLMFGDAAKVLKNYQMLIYAPSEKYIQLVEEYRRADADPEYASKEICDTTPKNNEENLVENDDFDPGLTPETTTVYPAQGAEICSIQILNGKGDVVNILSPGSSYEFVISGKFLEDCRNIYFGVHIKTISGVVVTGQRYPGENKIIESARAGEEFKITFNFSMSVIPGTYFAGCGIWSNNEPNCLHRIMDAIMFRVAATEVISSFGYCDLMSSPPLYEVVQG